MSADPTLPEIHVEVRRPTPDGPFDIRVMNSRTNKVISKKELVYDPQRLTDLYAANVLARHAPDGPGDTARETPPDAPDPRAHDRRAEMVRYGQRLYGDLFGDGARLRSHLEDVEEFRHGARFTLLLDTDAAQLWNVPWEYLHDGDCFLAVEGGHTITRAPLGENLTDLSGETAQAPRPLRVLVVLADPEGVQSLNMDGEVGIILRALDEASRRKHVHVDFVEEGSLENITRALQEDDYHVLHYIGHGGMRDNRSFLALENAYGEMEPASIDELLPVIRQGSRTLRLVILNGCQTGRIDETEAMSGVATGLLQAIPAVAAMQFSVLDSSAIVFAEALYGAIGRGETLEEAMKAARLAMSQREPELTDWGFPALYLRAHNMRLVDPAAPPAEVGIKRRVSAGGLPVPPVFVGRRKEQRALRRALQDPRQTVGYLWGVGGVGKSALAGRLIERPGGDLDDAFVVRCHEVSPGEIPDKLAAWLELRANAPQAAAILRDSRFPYDERVQYAAQVIADRRFILVIDNFESVLKEESGRWIVPDAALNAFFRGLTRADWRSLTIFTSRYRWAELDALPGFRCAECHLSSLSLQEAAIFLRNLPRLGGAKVAEQLSVIRRVGGHPHTLRLLEGYLEHHSLADVLETRGLRDEVSEEWERYFLADLLSRLTPQERAALDAVSVLDGQFWAEQVAFMAGEDALTPQPPLPAKSAGIIIPQGEGERDQDDAPLPEGEGMGVRAAADSILRRWEALSLAQLERVDGDGDRWYSLHPVVRTWVFEHLPAERQRDLHLRAAAMIGRPFVQTARQALAQAGQTLPPEDEFDVACQVIEMITQRAELAQAQGTAAQALEWRRHLYEAGEYERADDIVNKLWLVLGTRWGQRDLAKRLLNESIATLEGGNKPVAQGNLASMLKNEGKLDEALKTYDAVYETFAALDDKGNMAAVLSQQANVYRMKGDVEAAIAKESASLDLERERGNREGQAISLHQLSMLYRRRGEYGEAMRRSQEAEALAREIGTEHYLAAILHEQGNILNLQDQPGEAFARFTASLDISRRIGVKGGAADSLSEIGSLLRRAGQYHEAAQAHLEALQVYQELGAPVKVAIELEKLGLIHEDQGDYGEALVMLERALALMERYTPHDTQITLDNLARVKARQAGR